MHIRPRRWLPYIASLMTAAAMLLSGVSAVASPNDVPTTALADSGASTDDPNSYQAILQRENDARQRFAAAVAQQRAGNVFLQAYFPSNDAWADHDAFLEGVQRLQRGDRMAWIPPQCERIQRGVERYYDGRGPNRVGQVSAQLETATILNLASHCDLPALGGLAMRGTSMALPDMRERGTERRLATALSLFSASSDRASFQHGDVRLAIPFFECLLTIGDAAGLERVIAGLRQGKPRVGLEQLARYETIVRNAPKASLRVNAPEGCQATIDGVRVRSKVVELRTGSHAVGCENGEQHRFSYSSQSQNLFPDP